MRKDGWTNEEDQVLYNMYGKFEYKRMMDLLPNRTKSAIAGRATLLALKGNVRVTMPQASRKYEVNEKFFDLVNTLSACFAGLLAADGSINKKKKGVQIRLKVEDGYLLREWAARVGYTGIISDYSNGGSTYSPKGKHTFFYVYGVPQWVKQLNKIYNITPNKSLTLFPPNLAERDHILAFMSGYIDGDGSIMFKTFNKVDPKNKKVYPSSLWSIAFCGTKDMCVWFKTQCDLLYPPKKPYRGIERYKDKNVWQYRISGKRALLLLQDALALDLPRLSRKWQPVIDYLNSNNK